MQLRNGCHNDLRILEKRFRPAIEGGTVADFLIVAYHIWFGTVSGGGDVFFIVSGDLITISLSARFERGRNNQSACISARLRQSAPFCFCRSLGGGQSVPALLGSFRSGSILYFLAFTYTNSLFSLKKNI